MDSSDDETRGHENLSLSVVRAVLEMRAVHFHFRPELSIKVILKCIVPRIRAANLGLVARRQSHAQRALDVDRLWEGLRSFRHPRQAGRDFADGQPSQDWPHVSVEQCISVSPLSKVLAGSGSELHAFPRRPGQRTDSSLHDPGSSHRKNPSREETGTHSGWGNPNRHDSLPQEQSQRYFFGALPILATGTMAELEMAVSNRVVHFLRRMPTER